ncbi:hypothetical protein ACFLWG_00430 [Chloroflexota bacterium]
MVNWQVTATTIYCDAVDDEVTLMVFKDGVTKCTGYKKYHEPGKEISKLFKRKGARLDRKLECEGPECSRVIQYRDKLFAEDAIIERSEPAKREVVEPAQGEGDARGE